MLAIMCENKAFFTMLLTAAAIHLNAHIHINVSIIRVQCRHLPFMYCKKINVCCIVVGVVICVVKK